MLKKEREYEIVEVLKNNSGFVSVRELCEKLYSSPSSIRRDLSILENDGIVKRTHGGAQLITSFSNIISFNKRAHHSSEAKKLIAKKAKTLIKDGDIIFLDQSSTSFYLANEIMYNHSLTVITNNIAILSLLSDSKIKTISSGGTLSNANRTCLIGTDAHYIFENTLADIVFFSTRSLSYDGIISDCDREEISVRNSMIKNAKLKVFLCDNTKLGTQSPYRQCHVSDINYIISDSDKPNGFSKLSPSLKAL